MTVSNVFAKISWDVIVWKPNFFEDTLYYNGKSVCFNGLTLHNC